MRVTGLSQLRVRLLGGLDVEGIPGPSLGSRKARTLMKSLALARGAAVPADAVVEALWPEDNDVPARAVEQVGVLVSRLGAALGAERLRRSDAGWALVVDWLDVAELEARVDEAAARLDVIEGRLRAHDFDAARKGIESTAEVMSWNGVQAWHHHQRFLSLSARHALATEDHERAAALASGVVADCLDRHTLRYALFARLTLAQARLAAGDAIDRDELDGVLVELEHCAGLEVWRLTAELAAAAGVDRWWRDAERRAGALVVQAGEHGETLRRYVATTFAALGR